MHFRTLHIIEEFFLLFRKKCNVDIPNVHLSDDVRKILVNVKIEDTLITFINVYAPNTQ